jgi:hypothetical protein
MVCRGICAPFTMISFRCYITIAPFVQNDDNIPGDSVVVYQITNTLQTHVKVHK